MVSAVENPYMSKGGQRGKVEGGSSYPPLFLNKYVEFIMIPFLS